MRGGRAKLALVRLLIATPLLVSVACEAGSMGAGLGAGADQDRSGAGDPSGARGVVERACALPAAHLVRIWRGVYEPRSEDLIVVPRYPNYPGRFEAPNHSGPWRYLQEVPLVLYGPGHIAARGRVSGPAGLVDLYATAGRLAGVPLQKRAGRVLDEALLEAARPRPKLIITVVWDGVGRNVLDLWRGRWPTLARLERDGTSFVDATVGSSPTITPATHSTLGTGSWPRTAHVTGIDLERDGSIVEAFEGAAPGDLDRTTFADDIDRAYGNRSIVGLLGWSPWHLGMLGHGAAIAGGDADQVGLVGIDRNVTGNDAFYSTPSYLPYMPGFEALAGAADRADGRVDDRWMGHDVFEENHNPAWVRYGTDMVIEMLEREGYGRDAVPDLFFTNYKMSDLIGHRFSMHSREMGAVVEEQDRALRRIVEWLDDRVGDYTLVVTADHGHTPTWDSGGGWPVMQGEITRDIDRHFAAPRGTSFVQESTAVGSFLNNDALKAAGMTATEIALFLNHYTMADNFDGERFPRRFAGHEDDEIIAAAFPAARMDKIMRCKFGSARPPARAGLAVGP